MLETKQTFVYVVLSRHRLQAEWQSIYSASASLCQKGERESVRDYSSDRMPKCRTVTVVMIFMSTILELDGFQGLRRPLSHNPFRRMTFLTCPSVSDQPQSGHLHHRLHHANIPPLTLHTDLIPQDPLQLIRLIPRHVFGLDPHWMLCVVQVVVGGLDLLCGYPRFNIMKLVQ